MLIRSAKGDYASMSADQKAEAAQAAWPSPFSPGVTLGKIKAEVLSLSVKVNDAVRKNCTLRADASASKDYFQHVDVGQAG